MKNFLLTLVLIVGVVTISSAQSNVNGKAVISTPTVHCESCKDRIEKFLSREAGVTSAKVDVKKKTTTVTWIKDRTNLENIKTAIANVGYDADDVAAEETMFRRLPKACQVKLASDSSRTDSLKHN